MSLGINKRVLRGGLAWIKRSKKDMAVILFYCTLEYSLIKQVGPRKKAQVFPKLPQKMH